VCAAQMMAGFYYISRSGRCYAILLSNEGFHDYSPHLVIFILSVNGEAGVFCRFVRLPSVT
jgi:hypothetical protein